MYVCVCVCVCGEKDWVLPGDCSSASESNNGREDPGSCLLPSVLCVFRAQLFSLSAALEVNSQVKTEMEDQQRVVHRLSADNARLIRQVRARTLYSTWTVAENRVVT